MCCSNNTDEQTMAGDDTIFFQTIMVAQLSIFTFVFVLGFWGNVMVIATIFYQNSMRTSAHYFIANLAVSDLVGLCLSMPLAALDYLVDWPFGSITCRFINPLKDLFLHVSMITLTAIAVDRCIHIAHPFRSGFSIYKTKLVIALIWLVDYLLVPLPMALIMQIQPTSSGLRSCMPTWSAEHRRVTRVCLASFILLSMCVTAVAYLRIAVAMKEQRQRIVERAQSSGISEKIYQKQLERNIKTVKAMALIVVVFWISALPLTFTGLLFEFEAIALSPREQFSLVTFVVTLLFVQNCANPVILYVMSGEMRAGFAACMNCRRHKRKPSFLVRSQAPVNSCSKASDDNTTPARGVRV